MQIARQNKALYCEWCQLKLGEQERNLVMEGQKVYHERCHEAKRRASNLKAVAKADAATLGALGLLVLGFFFA